MYSMISDSEWDSFVDAHPRGNIFQTTQMMKVYEATKNYEPIRSSIVGPDGEIKGLMAGVVIREFGGIAGRLSSRCVIQGGPLVEKDNRLELVKEILNKHDQVASRMCVFSEIRNMFDPRDDFSKVDTYYYEDHLNYLIDVSKEESEIFFGMAKDRKRNVKKAEKKGVRVMEIESSDDIPIMYSLLQETYSKVKIPLADISLFEAAYKELGDENLKIFFCYHNDEAIGVRAVLTYKNSIFDWYAGAKENRLNLSPNDYLVWYILKWGANNGYSVFDFGGAGHPEKPYGPRDFKKRFGGQEVNFGRMINVHSKLKYSIAKNGFSVYQKMLGLWKVD